MTDKEIKEMLSEDVNRHREMWMEIARICKEDFCSLETFSLNRLKAKALANLGYSDNPKNMCYACRMSGIIPNDISEFVSCSKTCPFIWNDRQSECYDGGLYYRFIFAFHTKHYTLSSEIALKIANLPVREWDEENQCFK